MPAAPRLQPPVEVDGILDLPPGKIAAVATYLQMFAPPDPQRMGGRAPAEGSGAFERLAGDVSRYRDIYGRVGQPWLWFSRTLLDDDRLAAIIDDRDVEALAWVSAGRDRGMIELDFRRSGECELCFLGLAPEAIGHGHGRQLVREAIARAFARPIRRLWLHTCTLDHPGAVAFYMGAGFVPFRRAVEVADDPRLTGHMPRTAAPATPIV